jgi:hypothetical protein
MTSAPAASPERICVFDGAAIRIDYATGRVTAATGTTAQAWAQVPGAIHGIRWGLSFGIEEADLEPDQPSQPDLRSGVTAAVALIATLIVRTLGTTDLSTSRLIGLATTATRLTSRSATTSEAEQVVAAVRWASHWMPFRVACLEESIAAVLVLAARRRRVTWCHGVAPDPVQFHAWIQTDRSPVAEPSTTSRYTVLSTIP